MAKIEFKGLDEYVAQLEKLTTHAEGHIKMAVYDGAAVVAKSVASALQSLPVDNSSFSKEQTRSSINSLQKKGLIDSMGLAKMRDEGGYINTKLGFSGYNSLKTKKYPNGQPNIMVARSLESGTSYMRKNPVVRKASNSAKAQAETVMRARLEAEIQKLIK